jgi:molecular chaperone GrpE
VTTDGTSPDPGAAKPQTQQDGATRAPDAGGDDAAAGGGAEALAGKLREQEERYLRLAAEYQNYRRRVEKDAELRADESVTRLVTDLLPVFDALDKAIGLKGDPAAAVSGLEGMEKLLHTALAKHQIAVVDPSGGAFDPRLHEALVRQPKGDVAAGTVLAVFEKGWTLRAKLVRAARVAVAAPPQGA